MKKQFLLVFTVIMAVMLVFAGCASDPDATPTTPDGTESSTGDGELPAELVNNPAANNGNVFNYAQVSPPGIFNPLLYTATYDGYVVNLVFDRLLEYDPETMDFVEAMAESYTVDEEAGTVEFVLRQGIQIHEGYGELTAEDVAFTLRMFFDPSYDGPRQSYYSNIIGAEAFMNGEADTIEGIILHTAAPEDPLPVVYDETDNDPYKITLCFNNFTTSNLHGIAGYLYILPRAYYEQDDYSGFSALSSKPIGTGPYCFAEYVADQYIELDKFADYWKTEPKIDKIIYHCVVNDSNIPGLQNGTFDFAEIRNIDEDLNLVEADGYDFLNIETTQGGNFAFVKFRMTDEITSDPLVRQALAYGFNRQLFIDAYFSGRASLTYAPVPKDSAAYPDDSELNLYEYDPELAGELLDQAGWVMGDDGYRYKDGQRLVINYTGISDNANDTMKTAMMVEDYKAIGVEFIPSYYDWASYMDLVKTNENTQMFGYANDMQPDPYTLAEYYLTGSLRNDGFYSNPEYDELVAQAKMELDTQAAGELYQEAFKILNQDLPVLFLNDYTQIWVSNARVKNLVLGTFINWTYNIEYMEIVQP